MNKDAEKGTQNYLKRIKEKFIKNVVDHTMESEPILRVIEDTTKKAYKLLLLNRFVAEYAIMPANQKAQINETSYLSDLYSGIDGKKELQIPYNIQIYN
ncbi:MAG: hypothetical protein KAT28_03310 [Candidatus Aenigmarchaeota archaeon]|nr:hypothetical protein [Candidatus Aenigmarchaeota archaeon]